MTGFGVVLPGSRGIPPRVRASRATDLASAAEASGFGSLWVADPPLDPRFTTGEAYPPLEATTLLGALAALTSRIDVGVAVLDVGSWNPGILAKTITTLDVIAGGRALLGIMVERPSDRRSDLWADPGQDPPDGPPPPDPVAPGESEVDVEVAEEVVRICRSLFTADDVSLAGRHFHLERARNQPRPTRPGGPPVLIGGHDRTRFVPLVARYGDKCAVAGTPDAVATTVELLQRHCEEIGRDPGEIDVVLLAPCVLAAPAAGPTSATGTAGAGRVAGGASGVDAGILVGRPHQIPELVADYLAAGVDEVVFGLRSPVDPDAIVGLGDALGLAAT